jgi:hypothetical protein
MFRRCSNGSLCDCPAIIGGISINDTLWPR